MKMSDNGKKKAEDEEIEEEEEEVVIEKKKTTSSNARSNMIRFMLIVVGIVCLFLLVIYIISVTSTHTYTYEEVEEVMKSAAKSYFNEHPESLPKTEGSAVEISVDNLVVAEKMDPLVEYLGEDSTCTGNVRVEKIDSEYLYVPYLNCGESYTTVELYKKVLEQGVVSTGYGLYANNNSYIYRGENVNNYVKLDNGLWRIVKVTPQNNVVLIYSKEVYYSRSWDDRYNEAKMYDAGINQYSASRIKEYLDTLYKGKVEYDDEKIFSNADKAKMVLFDLCVGKRDVLGEKKDNSEECSSLVRGQRIGLLTLSDYLYASVDPNCKSADSRSCKNYNYLAMNDDWWLITANKADDCEVFCVTRSGNVQSMSGSNYAAVRPVIYLNSGVLYKTGNGSELEPFEVR